MELDSSDMAPERGLIPAVLVLAATAAATVGWMGFADRPRAGQAFACLLTGLLAGLLRARAGESRLLRLACSLALLVQAAGLSCTLWYERLSSRQIGVCDEGTGLPVGLVFAVGTLLVAAEFLPGRKP